MALVSILMTAYNREPYIGYAIDSVLASTFKDWELIIVDDGSKDKTVSIAQAYELKDERIKLYINEKNLGDYGNRNRAAALAKGKYLQYVDSDDMLHRDSLAETVAIMEADAGIDIAMVGSDAKIEQRDFQIKEAVKEHFFKEGFLNMGPGSTIMRRDFFERIGKYPELYGPANDAYFHLKAAALGRIVLLDRDIMFYRIHEGQEKNNTYSYLSNNFKYQADALKELPLGLSKEEISWLSVKNKRRFTVNLSKYLAKTKSIGKTLEAAKKGKMHWLDPAKGLLHIQHFRSYHKPIDSPKKINKLYRFIEDGICKLPFNAGFPLFRKLFSNDNWGMIVALHRVLGNEEVGSTHNSILEIKVQKLEELIQQLLALQVQFVTLKEAKEILACNNKPNKPIVHFSFDDAYKDNLTLALPIFEKYRVPFSVFVTSDFVDEQQPFVWWYMLDIIMQERLPLHFEKYGVELKYNAEGEESVPTNFNELAEFIGINIDRDFTYFKNKLTEALPDNLLSKMPPMLTWSDLKKLQESGLCEIGNHSKSHPRFANLTQEQKINQIQHCGKRIEAELGFVPTIFSYPYGAASDIGYANKKGEWLKEEGIELAVTTEPKPLNSSNNLLLLPRVFFTDAFNNYTVKSRLSGIYQSRK